MSSRKRRQYIKKIRDSIPTITLKELADHDNYTQAQLQENSNPKSNLLTYF